MNISRLTPMIQWTSRVEINTFPQRIAKKKRTVIIPVKKSKPVPKYDVSPLPTELLA
jgi:hypothetical protein